LALRNDFRFNLYRYVNAAGGRTEEPTTMSTFHHIDECRAKHPLRGRVEKRLAMGQSIAVIAGLSILCWGVLVLFIVAVRATF
jgi:hypothetical protein